MIRRLVYLACDICLEICDDSDADTAADARGHGKRAGYVRRPDPRADDRRVDICPKCQRDPTRNFHASMTGN